jgi:hypothetical protein
VQIMDLRSVKQFKNLWIDPRSTKESYKTPTDEPLWIRRSYRNFVGSTDRVLPNDVAIFRKVRPCGVGIRLKSYFNLIFKS